MIREASEAVEFNIDATEAGAVVREASEAPTPISRGTYPYFVGHLPLFLGAPTSITRGTYPY